MALENLDQLLLTARQSVEQVTAIQSEVEAAQSEVDAAKEAVTQREATLDEANDRLAQQKQEAAAALQAITDAVEQELAKLSPTPQRTRSSKK